jgi:hypothetical protein
LVLQDVHGDAKIIYNIDQRWFYLKKYSPFKKLLLEITQLKTGNNNSTCPLDHEK